MKKIFISYRRDDTAGFTGRLFQSLTEMYGKGSVFMDVAAIEPGLDFLEVIDANLASCGAMLVMIGKNWLNSTDENGNRRLDNPDDPHRLEIARALKRKKLRVIPILVRDGKIPSVEDLPDDIKALSRRNGIELRHGRWEDDVNMLAKVLEKTMGLTRMPAGGEPAAPVEAAKNGKRSFLKRHPRILLVAGLILFTVFMNLLMEPGEPPSVPEKKVYEKEVFEKTEPSAPEVTLPKKRVPEKNIRYVSPATIRKVQSALSTLGYYKGGVDGRKGPQTTAAIKAFQSGYNMVADGMITDRLISSLQEEVSARKAADASLTGLWKNTNGTFTRMRQQGNNVAGEIYNPVTGAMLSEFSGVLSGTVLDFRYRDTSGDYGSGRAFLSPDRSGMTYSVRSMVTGAVTSGILYRTSEFR